MKLKEIVNTYYLHGHGIADSMTHKGDERVSRFVAVLDSLGFYFLSSLPLRFKKMTEEKGLKNTSETQMGTLVFKVTLWSLAFFGLVLGRPVPFYLGTAGAFTGFCMKSCALLSSKLRRDYRNPTKAKERNCHKKISQVRHSKPNFKSEKCLNEFYQKLPSFITDVYSSVEWASILQRGSIDTAKKKKGSSELLTLLKKSKKIDWDYVEKEDSLYLYFKVANIDGNKREIQVLALSIGETVKLHVPSCINLFAERGRSSSTAAWKKKAKELVVELKTRTTDELRKEQNSYWVTTNYHDLRQDSKVYLEELFLGNRKPSVSGFSVGCYVELIP